MGTKTTPANCFLVSFYCVPVINRAFRGVLYALAQCQKVRKGKKQSQPYMTTSSNPVVHEGDGSDKDYKECVVDSCVRLTQHLNIFSINRVFACNSCSKTKAARLYAGNSQHFSHMQRCTYFIIQL